MQKYKLSLKPKQIFILKLLDTAGKFDLTKNQHVKNQTPILSCPQNLRNRYF